MKRPHPASWQRRGRRGSVYVFVLGAGMLLAVAGMALLTTAQITLRSAVAGDDGDEAAALAESGVELALARINANANWRTAYSSNVEVTPCTLGRGTVGFKLVDETDGSLSNNTGDPVRVYGIGRCNKATRVYSVRCGPAPLSCLQSTMTFGQAVTVSPVDYVIKGSSTISSNGNISAVAAKLFQTGLDAAGTLSLGASSGTGTRKAGAAAKVLPDSATVFDYYVANGTQITGVPSVSGVLQITSVLISPANNPYGGGTNARGIYYIDCAGANVLLAKVRLVGTLVLRNCGLATLQTQIIMAPAQSGYPVLMVQGNMAWTADATRLAEATAAVNFNPPGTPYPYNYGAGGGVSNATLTDRYQTQIAGLVYINGTFDTSSALVLNKGVIVCTNSWAPTAGSIDLTYEPASYTSPPPGFLGTKVVPVAATWRWESAP